MGISLGTNSVELNETIVKLDSLIGKLFEGLRQISLFDSTNVIIVSDHGMSDVSGDRIINVEEILEGCHQELFDYGPVMYVFPDKCESDMIYKTVKISRTNFKVYRKRRNSGVLSFFK